MRVRVRASTRGCMRAFMCVRACVRACGDVVVLVAVCAMWQYSAAYFG